MSDNTTDEDWRIEGRAPTIAELTGGFISVGRITTHNHPTNPYQVRAELANGRGNNLREQAERVLAIAGETLTLFVEKNVGYGPTSEHLGAKGQYADMWRKMGKLKHTLWDGNPTVGEDIEQMLMDLVGHALLTIDFLREERK